MFVLINALGGAYLIFVLRKDENKIKIFVKESVHVKLSYKCSPILSRCKKWLNS